MRQLCLIVLLMLPAAAALADFTAGLQAFDAGDYETALAEWRPLAEAGDGEAQLALAGLYMQGVGVGRDPARAAQWYLRAARQGLVMAQLNLGDLHARGLGVRRDPVQAYRWLELAARQNHAWARNRRDQLAGAMTPAQIDEARRLADGFRAETGSSR